MEMDVEEADATVATPSTLLADNDDGSSSTADVASRGIPDTILQHHYIEVEPDIEESAKLVGCAADELPTPLFEPPFTAPLAPFDMALVRRFERNAKRNEERYKRSPHIDSRGFLQSERGGMPEIREGELGAGDAVIAAAQKLNGKWHAQRDGFSESGGGASTRLLSGDFCGDCTSKMSNTPIPLAKMTDHIVGINVENFHRAENISDCCPRAADVHPDQSATLFFDDHERSIDFVLAYKEHKEPLVEAANSEKRHVFQENLMASGLELECTAKEMEHIHFVKIHAPLEVLRRYAEILKLRMPMAELNVQFSEKTNRLQRAAKKLQKLPGMAVVNRSSKSIFSSIKCVFDFFLRKIYVDERYFPKVTHRFTAIYSRDKEYLFNICRQCFFTAATRSRIVQFILDRQRFPSNRKDEMAFGIERLIAENVYSAAYPLHDGDIKDKGTMREVLYTHWACVNKWYRYQPLDYIKQYFGVKIGLYFAWLGFYTYMLLLASVVGIFCFIYSAVSLKNYVPVQDICISGDGNHNFTMCPLCDWCQFWDLNETCVYAKITYLIDNPSTVFFAVFMSFWATLFLELWKRYSAEITHRWDLTGFDVHEEHPRPQYLAKLDGLPATRIDYVTNVKEPQVPFWRMKLPATVFSFSVVLLLVALAFVALVAVVIYRMSIVAALKVSATSLTTSNAIMLATASAAFINLCLLFVLNYLYNHLAEYLTEMEMWRTQTQFDDSLTLKIYLLQFVNYYASIFYIAFFKGKFVGHPGEYHKLFDYRQEECSSGGCLTELCVQLAIIMIGKQAFNTILEVVFPLFWRKVQSIQMGLSRLLLSSQRADKPQSERWLRDLKLLDWGPRSLFPEYLEMVLQYGFVTIFVAAFPLAPFFALLNNILEMRLDAKKLLTHHKRPVSQRVRDIGVWYRILDSIGKLSVITNGFIIAFTSDFIPRLVYRAFVSKDNSLHGYVDFTLSVFNVTDSATLRSLVGDNSNITTCRYTDFREPPRTMNEYRLSAMYYIVLACRLGFVVLFENFVALVMIMVRWCIPDMSIELRDQIRREVYITNEIIIEMEAKRARDDRKRRSNSMRYATANNSSCSLVEPNEKFIKLEKFLSENLTQSQMDLILHKDDTVTGIAGSDHKDIPPNTP